MGRVKGSSVVFQVGWFPCWCWGALCRDSAGVAQLMQVRLMAGWDQLLFQGWGKGTFWAGAFPPRAPAVFGGGSSQAAGGHRGWCLVASPGRGLDLRSLSRPCPAPDVDGYTFSRELVANFSCWWACVLPSPLVLVWPQAGRKWVSGMSQRLEEPWVILLEPWAGACCPWFVSSSALKAPWVWLYLL